MLCDSLLDERRDFDSKKVKNIREGPVTIFVLNGTGVDENRHGASTHRSQYGLLGRFDSPHGLRKN